MVNPCFVSLRPAVPRLLPRALRTAARALAYSTLGSFALLPYAGRASGLDHRVPRDTGGTYGLQDAVPVSLSLRIDAGKGRLMYGEPASPKRQG